MKYEALLQEAESNGICIIENANFKSKADGLINGNVIGINRTIKTYKKRTCILAEELGHYYTTIGDILDLSSLESQKQEQKARLWAYNELIGLNGIISAYQNGCQNLYETAEYLDVTENFLKDTLQAYSDKYGVCVEYGEYLITFIPTLNVELKKLHSQNRKEGCVL